MPRRVSRFAALVLATSLLTVACDSTEPRGPGSIFISSSASQPEPNSGFYQYEIIVDDGTPRTAFVYEDVDFIINGLAAGAHQVRLSGVPSACNVGQNPRQVNLRGGDTAVVIFTIQCPRTTGDLQVNITTTGPDQDPGYVLLLGNLGSLFVPSNFSQLLTFVPAGTHSISLTDVASNCTASPAQSVTITAGQTSTVSFTVTCAPVAIVSVVTTTTGTENDADGFVLTLGSTPTRVPANGRVYLRSAEGTNNWSLADVQPNCVLGGASSGSVNAAAGDTTTITIDATCSAIGYGTAGTTAMDAAGDTLGNPQGSSNQSHDLVQMTTRYATDWFILVLRFTRPVGSVGMSLATGLHGVVDLDVDENANTGAPPLANAFGGSAPIGSDYRIDLFLSGNAGARLLRFQSGDTTTQLAPMSLEGDSVVVKIPLAKLGGDDGRMAISALFGTDDRPTDVVPNSGAILARPSSALLAGLSVIELPEGLIRKGPAEWRARTFSSARDR